LQDQIELGCKYQLQTEPDCFLHEEGSLTALPLTRSLLIMFQNMNQNLQENIHSMQKEKERE